MDKLPTIARILLGLIFFVFGLNGFLQFMPVPEPPPEAGKFLGALVDTGYLMTVVKLTETVCGLLLLIGVFVPLSLTILAPIILNIFLFHIFLAPGDLPGLVIAVLIVVLEIYLAWAYRKNFSGVLEARATPTS